MAMQQIARLQGALAELVLPGTQAWWPTQHQPMSKADRMNYPFLFFKMHVSSPEYQAFVIRTCLLFFNRVPSVQLLFPFMYDPNPLPLSPPKKNISF